MGNGIAVSALYNPRLEITSLAYGPSASPIWSRQYGWTPNGNLQQAVNLVAGTTRQYGYDTLNRLTSALDVNYGTQNPTPGGLSETYGIDPFGNLEKSGNFTFLPGTYTTANQLPGWSYDASGDLRQDALGNRYTWDANGMISSANGINYFYDAGGNRVGKSGSGATDTVYFGGRPIARLQGGAWTDLVYGASGLLAEFSGAPIYRMTDQLGSAVGMLSSSGGLVGNIQDYAPYGELFNGSATTDPFKFTGKELDAETGNDYFGARNYASSMGRWMSPDPINLTNARAMNPANTLNKYAYGANNTLKYVDPDGKDITIYYRAPSGGATDFGHVMLGVLNQSTGQTAFIDFYPKNGTDALGRGPGTFNLGDMGERGAQNANGQFASLTIQTNPEQAQALIDAITKMENGQAPDYSAFIGTNCTTLIQDALKDLGLDYGDQSPSSYWADLFATQSTGSWADKTIAAFTLSAPHAGRDYGRPRYNNQSQLMFALYWLQMHPDQDKSSVSTTQGPATPCGGNTGNPCPK